MHPNFFNSFVKTRDLAVKLQFIDGIEDLLEFW